ncbi:putative acetyltransferase [Anaerotaenia torta]|uniref:GNAT family N-acetyltransferase n=1 Tax=Anaerotaenia torta TaxID=433293 RepID=UPI003D19C232
MKTLETQRLLLRTFCEEDLDDFYEYAKSPKVGPNAGWPPHNNKEESRKILDRFMEEDEVWAIVLKEKNKLIGSIGLHHDRLRSANEVLMLGYVLSDEYWGQGLMTEACHAVISFAFESLGIQLLTVHYYAHNLRSRRVIEKCGFQYEGTLRRCAKLYDGSIHDLVCYSMTRQEWQDSL